MDSCHCCATAAHFDTAEARRDLRRFQRRGPDASTRQLLTAVQARSLPPDPTLLDIGGGIGAIHHLLLKRGFGRATHVDASDSYLAVAAEEAKRLGHGDRVQFHFGEFPAEGSALPAADVVTLDRVVCCDPDYAGLLRAAADHARRVLAFSYPRARWYLRLTAVIKNAIRRLSGSEFRFFVHSPDRMKAVLEKAGLRRVWEGGTWIWAVDLFERTVRPGETSAS